MKKVLLPVIPAVIFVIIAFLFFNGGLHAASQSEKTIPLDPSLFPSTIAIDSLHHRAYIASHTTLAATAMPITILDTLHDTIVGVLPVSTLRALAVNETTHRLYTADSSTGKLTVFDTDTNVQIGTFSSIVTSPVSLALNESTNRLYIISNKKTPTLQTGMLTVIEGETGAVIADNISVGNQPTALAINSITNQVYSISAGSDSVLTIIDGQTNSVVSSIPIAASLIDIAVDTVLNRVYITNETGNNIFVVDGNTKTVMTQIPITNSINCAHTLTVDSTAHILYAACFSGLSVIDTKTNAIIQQTPLTGELPITRSVTSRYMAMDSVLNKVYVPLEETHQIAVVTLSDPPKIDPIKPVTGNEGSKLTFPFSFTDTNTSSWIVTADYGDGSPVETHTSVKTEGILQHVFTDNGTYTITLTITNAVGATSSLTTTATIGNVSPTVGTLSASSTTVSVNSSITVSAAFSDPGSKDTHSATWSWGDGIVSDGVISGSYTSGIASGTHIYKTAGVYTVLVTIIDKDNAGTTNKLQYVAVTDTTQSINGTGSIDSSKGAYKANTDIAGKMNIGFYTKNNPPFGIVQLNFQLANLDFHSKSISSVVTNGLLTQIRGIGVVNNSGNYGFILTVQESKQPNMPNTIRIKIQDPVTGNSIYDSQINDADSEEPKTILQK